MQKIYILYGENGEVLAFSNVQLTGMQEAELENTSIDLSRVYKVVADENPTGLTIALDEELEKQVKEQNRTKEAQEELLNFQSSLTVTTLLEIAPDDQALKMTALYPEWQPNYKYKEGKRIRYDGKLYKVRQDHTSEKGHEPGIDTASLYVEVTDKSGTASDPIPYNNNMELEKGKRYVQDGVVYLCIRDTGQPVYNPLKDLVDIYVTKEDEANA